MMSISRKYMIFRELSSQQGFTLALGDMWIRLRARLASHVIRIMVNYLRPYVSTYNISLIRSPKRNTIIETQILELYKDIETRGHLFFTNPDTEYVLRYFNHSRERMYDLIQIARAWQGLRGLSIGVGYGLHDTILRQHYGLEIIGTEISKYIPAYCPYAQAQGQTIVPWHMGVTPCPFEEGSFDFLIFAEVLEHLKLSPGTTIRLFASLLKPGGHLLLTTPNIARRSNILQLMHGGNILEPFREDLRPEEDPTDYVEHVREYTIDEVIRLVQEAGLCVTDVVMSGRAEAGATQSDSCPLLLNSVISVTARKS